MELDYFSFTLKWSKVGKLHTILVQVVLLNYIFFIVFFGFFLFSL